MNPLHIQSADSPDAPLAICIMGPTATGKTDLAMRLAEALPVDLISVDSAMVYRGLDIGSAKPDPLTLQQYPHRLIDILDPAEAYSAGQFCRDALAEMAEITLARTHPAAGGRHHAVFQCAAKWHGRAARCGPGDSPAPG